MLELLSGKMQFIGSSQNYKTAFATAGCQKTKGTLKSLKVQGRGSCPRAAHGEQIEAETDAAGGPEEAKRTWPATIGWWGLGVRLLRLV